MMAETISSSLIIQTCTTLQVRILHFFIITIWADYTLEWASADFEPWKHEEAAEVSKTLPLPFRALKTK